MPRQNIVMKTLKKNKTMVMFVLAVLTLVGVFYMITLMNTNTNHATEGFEAAEFDGNWDPTKEYLVVFCQMEGCGWCNKFKPVWEEVRKTMDGQEVNGKVCRMVTVFPGNVLTTGVEGYPTIRRFTELPKVENNAFTNTPDEMEGERTVENLTNFCKFQ
jgi:hypothetical protein